MPTQTFLNLPKGKQDRVVTAAVKEFSTRRFSEAKLSNIIKEAKIPRGSFYQYFEDKMDLYKHLFDIIAAKKMEYLTEDLMNPNNLAFFDLFRELYRMGLKFAIENPDYVKISSLMMARKDLVYQEIFGSNINIAIDFYKDMILRDQKEGRMDTNIDPDILAQLVIEMTMNVTLGALELSDHIDPKVYEEKIEKVIYIFEKGIKR
jgi:AcrR family transcriptional regulator